MTTFKHLETSVQIENGRVTLTSNNVENYFEPAHFGCDVADSEQEIFSQICEWLDDQDDMKKQHDVINDIINGDIKRQIELFDARQKAINERTTISEGKLRAVKVNYEDGQSAITSMAAHLTDEQIKEHFAVGRTFNLGKGEEDYCTIVSSIEILA